MARSLTQLPLCIVCAGRVVRVAWRAFAPVGSVGLGVFRCVHRGAYFMQMKTTTVRKLLPESWGFLCPVSNHSDNRVAHGNPHFP